MNDLRYSLRLLAKSPGFTVVSIIALALGIGANSAIFSLADGFLVRPLSYPNADRLVAVYSTPPSPQATRSLATAGDFADWRREATSFDILAAQDSRSFTLTGAGEPVGLQGAVVSPSLFEALGSAPILGRAFLHEEEQPGRDASVILHHGLWRDRFASDPGVVGRTLVLDGRP